MSQQRVLTSAGFSGRADCSHPKLEALRPELSGRRSQQSYRRLQREFISSQAQAESGKSFGDAVKNIARQVQGALPIVGLISRLAATSGGIGRDELAYPEFARQLLNQADTDFNVATSEWERRHGRVGQRKYIVLFLWMANTGLGLVPRKAIANAASRLRVSHDITAEMERFELERESALSVYSYVERPKGKTASQVSIAVDALCRLSLGIKDGEPIPEDDKGLIVPIVTSAFKDVDGVGKITEEAVSDASRESRRSENR